MSLNRQEIFVKSWKWALVTGAIFGIIYWIIADVFNLLKSGGDIVTFINILVIVSLVGNAIGGGTVMWRILDKYHKSSERKCLMTYIRLSVVSLLLATLVLWWTPISFASVLWFVAAPTLVIYTMNRYQVLATAKVKKSR